MPPAIPRHQPERSEQPDQRADMRDDAGDDGVHSESSPDISRVVGGGPVSGSVGTVACHASVIHASVDPASEVATAITSQTANSNILSDPAELADKSPLTTPRNGIVAVAALRQTMMYRVTYRSVRWSDVTDACLILANSAEEAIERVRAHVGGHFSVETAAPYHAA